MDSIWMSRTPSGGSRSALLRAGTPAGHRIGGSLLGSRWPGWDRNTRQSLGGRREALEWCARSHRAAEKGLPREGLSARQKLQYFLHPSNEGPQGLCHVETGIAGNCSSTDLCNLVPGGEPFREF